MLSNETKPATDHSQQSPAAPPGWSTRPPETLESRDRPFGILILESLDINRILLRGILGPEGYRLIEADTIEQALAALRGDDIDLVIVDLLAPGISGLEFCRTMKAGRRTRLIPVLMLTSMQGVESEVAGIASGADEFLVKPLHPEIVRTRIQAMLRHKAAIDSLEESEAILFSLAQAVELRDHCTGGHCERLASMSTTLGMALGLPHPQLLALHRGGFLHDIGKISIPDAILFKPGPLTKEEWAVMRTHPLNGEEICRHTRTLQPVLPIIRHHHERWDGSGYPDGLKGEAIPLLARILQIADIFDALTTVRPYKEALSTAQALDVLESEAARGWRDPSLVCLVRRWFETPADVAAQQWLIPWPPAEPMQRSLENMRGALSHT